MATFGRQVLVTGGANIQVTADGSPEWKIGGLTIDWSTVAAVTSDTTIAIEGTVVKNGNKFLRYGQVVTKITASGLYGPYDPAAADGRQTLVNGECFILNETVLQSGLIPGMPTGATDNPGGILGGRVFKARLLATSGAHSLAAGPTYTELQAVMPRVQFTEMT